MNDRYIVFDTETPNYRNDRICSIGLCVVEGGRITEEWYELVDPETQFQSFHIRLHGISPKLVAGKPNFAAFWDRFGPMFEDGVLVAHNAPFDMAVLAKCLRDYRIRWRPSADYACTCQMGRVCIPDAPNHRLNTLCQRLDIGLDHHNAASDSRACAQLLLYYMEQGLDIKRFVRTYDLEHMETVKAKRPSAPASL